MENVFSTLRPEQIPSLTIKNDDIVLGGQLLTKPNPTSNQGTWTRTLVPSVPSGGFTNVKLATRDDCFTVCQQSSFR